MMMNIYISRSLRGNVDRNLNHLGKPVHILRVVPYVGTWIEIMRWMTTQWRRYVVPYVGTWIEIESAKKRSERMTCRSLRGNVDRNLRTI